MSELEYKDWSPHVLNFTHQTPWQVVLPTVYRFMDAQYLQAFKDDGSLRLSSFMQFAKHSDEERQDNSEGKGFASLTDGDMNAYSAAQFGRDSYVLCGSISDAQAVSQSFSKTGATLVITDTVQFAGAVARALPGCEGGIQGMCTYQNGKDFNKKLKPGQIGEDYKKNRLPNGEMNTDFLHKLSAETAIEQLFTKDIKYAHQLEYRWIWKCGNVKETLDIKAPLALKFCKFKGL